VLANKGVEAKFMALTKDSKDKIIGDYRVSKRDTGSSEVQVAVLTHNINGLASHFKKMVNRRKKASELSAKRR